MKLLVCGGRTYNVYQHLDHMIKSLPQRPEIIITGGAVGADILAERWARVNGIHYATVPALWDFHGHSAGPRRNATMLLLKPDMCLAMPGGNGTEHMVTLCKAANIKVIRG